MRVQKLLPLTLITLLCLISFVFAEEEPAKPEKKVPVKLTAKQAITKFAPYIAVVKQGPMGMQQHIAIRIEGEHIAPQFLSKMSGAEQIALLVEDNLLMYPSDSFSFTNGRVIFREEINPGDPDAPKPVTVAVPDKKKCSGVELGAYKARNVKFANIELPEGNKMKMLPSDTNPTAELGEDVFVIGRRGEEWKYAPFFLPAVINGELKEKERKLYSLNLTQEQLGGEALGGLLVKLDGTILGIINRIEGKTFDLCVSSLSDFADAVNTAIDEPEKLEKDDARVAGIAGRFEVDIPPHPEDVPPEQEPELRVFFGVSVSAMSEEKAKELGFDNPTGVIIEKVAGASPAEIAGIQVGDVILEAEGQVIDSPKQLKEILAKQKPGDEIEVLIRRDDEEFAAKVKLMGKKQK